MNREVLAGIGIGAAICAAGIAFSPSIPTSPEAAALFAAGLGGIALLTAAFRHHPPATGVGATALLLLGGYALATGILTGAAALGAAALMAGVALLIGRTLLRGGAEVRWLPGGGST